MHTIFDVLQTFCSLFADFFTRLHTLNDVKSAFVHTLCRLSFLLIPAVQTSLSLHAYQFCALQTFCRPRAYIKQSKCVSLQCSSATGGGPSPLSLRAKEQSRQCYSRRILLLIGRSGGGGGGGRPPGRSSWTAACHRPSWRSRGRLRGPGCPSGRSCGGHCGPRGRSSGGGGSRLRGRSGGGGGGGWGRRSCGRRCVPIILAIGSIAPALTACLLPPADFADQLVTSSSQSASK